MTEIQLKNSKTRRMERLDPIIPGKVSMYLCGPTVYDRAHIGNARSAVAFDQLFRLLRHVYGPQNVTFVRNFTDVDDKINARAAQTGRPIADITAETSQWYLDDMGALGVLEPNHMPRATEYIAEMVAFIDDLIARGHAYAAEDHVLFSVKSYTDYGKFSGRSVDDMIAGARVEVAPYKRDPMDFVLWKPSSDDIPGWNSPWGRGRPGWHIECSAMSHAILGEEFDIHAGGADLKFPHHENEVAQSCAAGHAFARIWMHNEMLQVEGRKMSKSLGNFFTVRDLLDQGVPGEVIRFVFLSTHYGKPMDWTDKKRDAAEKTLRKWYSKLASEEFEERVGDSTASALADDLNTSKALTTLHGFFEMSEFGSLAGGLRLLGLWDGAVPDWAKKTSSNQLEELINILLTNRENARANKNYQIADLLRDAFKRAGVRVVDTKSGPEWSIERDEIDSASFFARVSAAVQSGDEKRIAREVEAAKVAGVHFADHSNLGESPAWRTKPDETHVFQELSKAMVMLEDL